MGMVVQGNIETFNDLIRAHRDRITEYEKATLSLKPQEAGLSSTFSEIIKESQQCIADLNSRIVSDGDVPADHVALEGKIYRIWIDLKVTFSSNPNYSLLDICEKGEDAMMKAYTEACKNPETLTPDDLTLLTVQREIVKKTHDLIKTKRDQYHELVKNNQII
jgi:uncharacterized protein (TIGR02284 family)